jgi:hypothetical protein
MNRIKIILRHPRISLESLIEVDHQALEEKLLDCTIEINKKRNLT